MQEMRPTIFLIPTLAIAFFAGEKGAFAQQYYGPPPVYYGQHEAEEAWEQRGIYDGMERAKRDFGNNRRPNVNNREEYRDPDSIPGWHGTNIEKDSAADATSGCGRSIMRKALTTDVDTGTIRVRSLPLR
jgi:hypothetical protein